MRYRTLGRTGMQVSEVGLGCEHLQGLSEKEIFEVVDAAISHGINIFDIFMSEPQVRTDIGKALAGRRDQVLLQGHIGAAWKNGQYCRTRDLAECKTFFEDFLARLDTDYVDIGMLHYIDTEADLEGVFGGPVIEYAKQLKESGVIRAIGMSSHNPSVAKKAVETGLIDVLMFSVNPAYDLLPEDLELDSFFKEETYQSNALLGTNPARAALYQTCERMGCGITVMKGFAAGALLSAERSPFGRALTPVQCIHYALTRPAVASILVGCKRPEEVSAAVAYETAGKEERDYSALLSDTPKYSLKGHCMYCNHCLPCPSGIDVAAVNRLLDLALLSDPVPDSVRDHYAQLGAKGSDCIACGSCEANCPFGVAVIQRMARAREVFEN